MCSEQFYSKNEQPLMDNEGRESFDDPRKWGFGRRTAYSTHNDNCTNGNKRIHRKPWGKPCSL